MNGKAVEVLLVEDNPGDARLIERMLARSGAGTFHVRPVERISQALEQLRQAIPDVVLLDLRLPDIQGIDTFLRLQEQTPQVAVIVLTGISDEELALRALQAGAQDYLTKGQVDGGMLSRSIRYAIERKRTAEELNAARVLLASFLENTPTLVHVVTADGHVSLVNRAWESFVGLRREQVVGQLLDVAFPPEMVQTAPGARLARGRSEGAYRIQESGLWRRWPTALLPHSQLPPARCCRRGRSHRRRCGGPNRAPPA